MPEKPIYYTDALEQMRRFEAVKRDAEQRRKVEELRALLPQGHGSGLDADTVDSYHADELLKIMDDRIAGIPRHGFAGGGGGSTLIYGSGIPANSLSFDGAYYLHTTVNDLYYKVAGAWVLIASFGAGFPTNANNWEDLRFPSNNIRLSGAAPATDQAYRGGVVLSFASNQTQFAYLTAQIPHNRTDDSDVVPHIHWTIPVAGLGGGSAENVKWNITYSWANYDDTFPAQSSDSVTVDVRNTPANRNIMTKWAPVPGVGMTFSSMMIISISRDVTVANDYGSAALLTEFDIHYKQDKLGTTNEDP